MEVTSLSSLSLPAPRSMRGLELQRPSAADAPIAQLQSFKINGGGPLGAVKGHCRLPRTNPGINFKQSLACTEMKIAEVPRQHWWSAMTKTPPNTIRAREDQTGLAKKGQPAELASGSLVFVGNGQSTRPTARVRALASGAATMAAFVLCVGRWSRDCISRCLRRPISSPAWRLILCRGQVLSGRSSFAVHSADP